MDLFNKAMKEYNQTNPASSESKEKICDIKNFYDAMTTYIHNKKPKEICLHARTMKKKRMGNVLGLSVASKQNFLR